MPLKIRCPHCQRTLVADEDTVGQEKLCPACGGQFSVPIPIDDRREGLLAARQCPHCDAPLAPGTQVCPTCRYDLKAQRRPPWRTRYRYWKPRTWALLGFGAVAAVALAIVGTQVYRLNARPPTPIVDTAPPPKPSDFGAEVAARLLAANGDQECLAAQNEFFALGPSALPALARAIEEHAGRPDNLRQTRNVRAAIDLFGRGGDARWLPTLTQLQEQPRFTTDAIRARALLGDETVSDTLGKLWLDALQRQLFFERLVREAPCESDAANAALLTRTRKDLDRLTEPLRKLIQPERSASIDTLLPALWRSWAWLGQQRGEAAANAIFELAKPPAGANLDFKERVRAARRTLDRAAQRTQAEGTAAAGVILAQAAPQYRSLRDRISTRLAEALPDAPPATQQTIAWALARLNGQAFAGVSDVDHPRAFDRQAVRDALRWARDFNIAQTNTTPTSRGRFPGPPNLVRRVVTPKRQLEADLLARLGTDWRSVLPSLRRWADADLGLTPRVATLVDATQRNPNYSGLAAGMILVARFGAEEFRPQLTLWRESTDQPAWVRGFALTTLRVLDRKRGRATRGWPQALGREMFDNAGQNAPDWRLWGELIAAGGDTLRDELHTHFGSSASTTWHRRLESAVEHALRQRE